jgi:hypothetical protein
VELYTHCPLCLRGLQKDNFIFFYCMGIENLKEIILLPKASRSALGLTQPPVERVFPRGVKRPWREADHSPPSSAEVKNEWSYTPTAPYAFVACNRKTGKV